MKGYIGDIEKQTLENTYFRKVLYTAQYSQLVVMSLKPHEEIGEETHHLDQFLRIEEGDGVVILNDVKETIGKNYVVVVPAGTKHNIINTSSEKAMKLYTVYSPPEHKDGTIHKTKEDAMSDKNDHFDGVATG